MPFLLCNILFAFPLFLHISSLVFCTSPWILCLKIGFMLIFMQVLCGGFFLFCFDLWDFSQKMTYCFLQSDVLFCIKRRVVFFKVTCCFHQNDVMFSPKRRVVLHKTTCCFLQSDVSFSSKWRVVFCARSEVKKPQCETPSKSQDFELWKNP